MTHQLQFLPEIPADIDTATSWYAAREANLAQSFLDQLQSVFARIADNPYLHAAGSFGIRAVRLKRFPYIVRYRVSEGTVLVVAITHASRHYRVWQNRM